MKSSTKNVLKILISIIYIVWGIYSPIQAFTAVLSLNISAIISAGVGVLTLLAGIFGIDKPQSSRNDKRGSRNSHALSGHFRTFRYGEGKMQNIRNNHLYLLARWSRDRSARAQYKLAYHGNTRVALYTLR